MFATGARAATLAIGVRDAIGAITARVATGAIGTTPIAPIRTAMVIRTATGITTARRWRSASARLASACSNRNRRNDSGGMSPRVLAPGAILFPLAHVDELAGNRRRRCHGGGNEVRAALVA